MSYRFPVSSIETLEARIAPAAVFNGIDVDGDKVRITTSKGTSAELATAVHLGAPNAVGGAQILSIDLTAKDAGGHFIFTGSTLTVAGKRGPAGGDGLVDVGSVMASGVDLGAVSISGDLQQITEGSGTAAAKMPSLTVDSFSGELQSIISGSAGSVTIRHDLDTALVIVTGSVDSLRIGGSILGGANTNDGRFTVNHTLKVARVAGTITGGGGGSSGSLDAQDLGLVTVGGSVVGGSGQESGSISSVNGMGSVKIGGDLIGGTADAAGTIRSGTEGAGNVGAIRIAGEVQGNAQSEPMIFVKGHGKSVFIGKSLTAGGSTGPGSIDSQTGIDSITIGGSVSSGPSGGQAQIDLSFKSLRIGGDVSTLGTGAVNIGENGPGATITISGSVLGSAGNLSLGFNDVVSFKVGHDVIGSAAAPLTLGFFNSLGSLSIGGRVEQTNISVDGGGAQLGSLKVGGSWSASNLYTGVTAGQDGIMGTADDRPQAGSTHPSKVGSMVIGGAVSGTPGGMFRFEAEEIDAFRVAGTIFKLQSGAHNDTDVTSTKLEVGGSGDVQIQGSPGGAVGIVAPGMVSHVFTTPVSRSASGLGTDDLRAVLEDLRALRKRETGEQRSNRGGWHSSGNLFALQTGPAWQALQAAVTRALFDYIGAVFSYSGQLEMALVAWAVINRPGDFNLMHNHASHLLSGALYLSVPEGMRGGEIYFQDPRLNLNAHETEAMRQIPLLPPWHTAGVSVTPAAGEILIFPSWLMHAVHPFTAMEPEAERVVLSFNATV